MGAGGSVTFTLDAAVIRCWSASAEQWLGQRRAELDEVNVFPVADSDTGTNLYLTFVDAAAALRGAAPEASVTETARLFARGALVGARGNSGVIVGQYVGALVRQLSGEVTSTAMEVTPAGLVTGLRTAADAAYAAVAAPVEGTVLTVARAVTVGAREAVLAAGPPVGALAALEHGIGQGYLALGRTTGQLAVLRAAGVLDAGAWGLLLVLDALAAGLGSTAAAARAHGRPDRAEPDPAEPDPARARGDRSQGSASPSDAVGPGPGRGTAASAVGPHRAAPGRSPTDGYGGGEFEVMYLVTAAEDVDVAPGLRAGLSRIGESVAVVGGDGLWQAHVHTDHPLEATTVPAALAARPSQLRIRHLVSQSGVHGSHRPALGLVAVTRAPGLVPDLARAGAVVVLLPPGAVAGAELSRAVDDTGAAQVLVLSSVRLPGWTSRGPVLRVLDGLAEVQVAVGAATVAARTGGAGPEALLAEVSRVVEAVRTAVVPLGAEPPAEPGTAAGRKPATDRGRGVGGVRQAETMLAAARTLLGTDGALLTVLTRTGTPEAAVDALRAGLVASHPRVEVVVLGAGLPGSDVELGVE